MYCIVLQGISINLQCLFHINIGYNGLSGQCLFYRWLYWELVRNKSSKAHCKSNEFIRISSVLRKNLSNMQNYIPVFWPALYASSPLLSSLLVLLFIALCTCCSVFVCLVVTVVLAFHGFSQLNLWSLTVSILTSIVCSVVFSHSNSLPHYFSSLEAIDMIAPSSSPGAWR